jgi:hypothetical protein
VEGIRAAHGVAAPTDADGDEEQRILAVIHAALDASTAAGAFATGRALTLAEAIALAGQTAPMPRM